MKLRRLLHEVHRRSVWQVFLIYLVCAWAAFEVSRAISDRHDLPSWLTLLFVALLAVGLLFVMTTVYLQEGFPRKMGQSASAASMSGGKGVSDVGGGDSWGVRRVFTWRNTILAGVAALSLWAIVAAAWLYVATHA